MKLSEATYFPDAKELTRHGFVSHMEDFIGKLIGANPLGADVDDYLKDFGIDSKKALKMLTTPEIADNPDTAVVIRTERIKNGGQDENGKPLKDEFQVIYKVPRRDLERGIKSIDEKLRNLYIKTFENHIVEGTVLNEDDGGGDAGGFISGGGEIGAAGGECEAACFPIQRRTFFGGDDQDNKDKKEEKNESKKRLKSPAGRLTMYITEEQLKMLREAVEMDTAFGDFGCDAPVEGDDETLDHKDMVEKSFNEYEWKVNEGEIRIDPENKGKFTATKKRTGKSTEELTHSKNPLTRKRAVFAQNCKKWSHKKKED